MSDAIRSRLPMAAIPQLGRRASAAARSVLHELADAWRHAAARREFEALDDATLRDLGMRRSEYDSYWAETHGLAEHTRKRVSGRSTGKQWP